MYSQDISPQLIKLLHVAENDGFDSIVCVDSDLLDRLKIRIWSVRGGRSKSKAVPDPNGRVDLAVPKRSRALAAGKTISSVPT